MLLKIAHRSSGSGSARNMCPPNAWSGLHEDMFQQTREGGGSRGTAEDRDPEIHSWGGRRHRRGSGSNDSRRRAISSAACNIMLPLTLSRAGRGQARKTLPPTLTAVVPCPSISTQGISSSPRNKEQGGRRCADREPGGSSIAAARSRAPPAEPKKQGTPLDRTATRRPRRGTRERRGVPAHTSSWVQTRHHHPHHLPLDCNERGWPWSLRKTRAGRVFVGNCHAHG